MGLGHVPPGPLSGAGAGSHLPRRQRREAREDGAQTLTKRRALVGEAGERFAVWWLGQRGMTPITCNVEIDGGELDLLMSDNGTKVAVEVRTVTGAGDPIDAVDLGKRSHVARLAGKVGASRVDYLCIGLRPWGVEVHWVPG
ncbi:MAG TPA: YraN family protein [Acidimicrobiia bacterium]